MSPPRYHFAATHYTHSATHCNTLQHSATHCDCSRLSKDTAGLPCLLVFCSDLIFCYSCDVYAAEVLRLLSIILLQHTTHTLQHLATHCNTLQHTATHCSTLQHIATHYNTLQHTATHCNTLQHTATHCNTLQHTETHCTDSGEILSI